MDLSVYYGEALQEFNAASRDWICLCLLCAPAAFVCKQPMVCALQQPPGCRQTGGMMCLKWLTEYTVHSFSPSVLHFISTEKRDGERVGCSQMTKLWLWVWNWGSVSPCSPAPLFALHQQCQSPSLLLICVCFPMQQQQQIEV